MECRFCNHINDPAAHFCSSCGEYLERNAIMACKGCGSPRNGRDSFCPACGYKHNDYSRKTETHAANGNCADCGSPKQASEAFCPVCGFKHETAARIEKAPLNYKGGVTKPQNRSMMPNPQDTSGAGQRFAHFGERAVASVIDFIVVFILFAVIENFEADSGPLNFLVMMAYFTFFESSAFMATPGKMAVGLEVAGPGRGRLGIGRAAGRFLAEYLSILTFGIGYLTVIFTKDKRALHDFIAGTFVLKK